MQSSAHGLRALVAQGATGPDLALAVQLAVTGLAEGRAGPRSPTRYAEPASSYSAQTGLEALAALSLEKFVLPTGLGDLVAFLASDAGRWISGRTIAIGHDAKLSDLSTQKELQGGALHSG